MATGEGRLDKVIAASVSRSAMQCGGVRQEGCPLARWNTRFAIRREFDLRWTLAHSYGTSELYGFHADDRNCGVTARASRLPGKLLARAQIVRANR